MKSEDVVKQLQAVLPKQTDYFTEKVSISSLTYSGGTVTAQTSTAHGLSTGDYINIQNALIPLVVSSLTRVGNTATCVTAVAHDLTAGIEQIVNISGASQTEYNGNQNVLTVPNKNTFTFRVSGTPTTPATGTIYANENYLFGFNGRFKVASIIDTTKFTYVLANVPKANNASGTNIQMIKNFRIAPILDLAEAEEAYTRQLDNDYWLFAEVGETDATRSREKDTSDSVSQFIPGIDFRQSLYQTLRIHIFSPTKNSISARVQRDSMEDIRVALYKTLVGVKFDTGFTIDDTYALVPSGDIPQARVENKAYYAHTFLFQLSYSLTLNDIVSADDSVAWRSFEIKYNRDDDYTLKDDTGELP